MSVHRLEHGPRHWAEESVPQQDGLWGSRRVRIVVLSVLGIFLFYHVVTKGLSAYLANSNPEAALFLNSNNPAALLNLAEDKLAKDASFALLDPVLAPPRNAGPGSTVAKGDEATPEEIPAAALSTSPAPTTLDDATLAEIRELAERAIASEPLNARAFRILGQISERTSDEMQTQKFMKAAVERSMLESVAVYWMMRKSFQDQNYKEALRYADILMRTRPQALPYIMPIMGKMAEIPEAADDLKLLLSNKPPWRPQFFAYFPQTITDARTPLDILLSVKESAAPPSAAELRPYLDFLIQRGFFDLAYYTWLQFLPPEQLAQTGHLYNGGFDAPPSGTPFDWVLTKGTGVTAQVAAKSDRPGERALHLRFGPGRVDYREVTQLIMLAPGSYQFQGTYKGDLVSERGLEWRVVCAGKQQNVIGRGLVYRGTSAQWQQLEFSFTVPETECPAQSVKLVFDARSASERFISGNIWFDDFKITRDQAEPSSGDAQQQPTDATSPQSTAREPASQQPPSADANGATPLAGVPVQPMQPTAPIVNGAGSIAVPQQAIPNTTGGGGDSTAQQNSPVQPSPAAPPTSVPAQAMPSAGGLTQETPPAASPSPPAGPAQQMTPENGGTNSDAQPEALPNSPLSLTPPPPAASTPQSETAQ